MRGGQGGGEVRDVCFLDDWKHMVQFTELERSKGRRAGSLGKLINSYFE